MRLGMVSSKLPNLNWETFHTTHFRRKAAEFSAAYLEGRTILFTIHNRNNQGPTVTSGRKSLRSFGPIPVTFPRSSTDSNGPSVSR